MKHQHRPSWTGTWRLHYIPKSFNWCKKKHWQECCPIKTLLNEVPHERVALVGKPQFNTFYGFRLSLHSKLNIAWIHWMNKHWLYHAKEFSAERYDIYCDTSLDRNRSWRSEQNMIDRDYQNRHLWHFEAKAPSTGTTRKRCAYENCFVDVGDWKFVFRIRISRIILTIVCTVFTLFPF